MKEDLLMDNGNKNNLKKPLIYGAIAFLIFIVIVIAVAIFQNSNNENQIVPAETKPQEVTPLKTQKTQSEFQPLVVEEEPSKIDKNKLIEENKSKEKEQIKQTSQLEKEEKTSPALSKETTKKPVEKQKKVSNGNYYIQVAALLKHAKPNKKFLEIIKKSGFNYKFYTTYIVKNGNKIKVTKILVGPFKTKSDAKKALTKVKEKITQNAFIFKVK